MPAGNDPGRPPLPPDLARLLHDLRGPLNSLTMHLEVLKRTVVGDLIAEDSLRTVHDQLARLADMLPAAFAIAALEPGEHARVDLRAVVDGARAQSGGVVEVGPSPWPTVVGDEVLLTLAVAHLLRNAVEATPAGRRPPLVSTTPAGEETLLRVRDWGPGLNTTNPKLLIRLMNSTKPGHRGLGLVTVERVARLHHGDVRFESPGDGAIVTLALPSAK
jgi:two-component system sensor histidine kinase HydH